MNKKQIEEEMHKLTLDYRSGNLNLKEYAEKQLHLMDKALELDTVDKKTKKQIRIQRLAVSKMYGTIKHLNFDKK